jgi:hypothetical protein
MMVANFARFLCKSSGLFGFAPCCFSYLGCWLHLDLLVVRADHRVQVATPKRCPQVDTRLRESVSQAAQPRSHSTDAVAADRCSRAQRDWRLSRLSNVSTHAGAPNKQLRTYTRIGQIFNPAPPELLRSVHDVCLGNGNPRNLHEPGQIRPGFQQRRGDEIRSGIPQHLRAFVR